MRFQQAGRIYYFAPAGYEDLEVGAYVVVETSRGLEVARVVVAPGQVVLTELSEPLKPLVRVAYQEDIERLEMFRAKAEDDITAVRRLTLARNLPIKIVTGSYNLDGTRLTVYFNPAGETRVDLRDLLRDVQDELNVQVQLRQVGPRDQAKAVGGYGACGRRLCCTTWLTAFPAISIKMAKEQNQPLNPSKISGQCGRLLCCLSYENDMYRQLKAEMPRVGTLVSTPAGDARVVGANALRQVVTLQMANFQYIEMPASALAMERGVVRIISLPDEEENPQLAALLAAPEPPAREPQIGRREPERRGGPGRGERERGPLPGGDAGPRRPEGPRAGPPPAPRETPPPTEAQGAPGEPEVEGEAADARRRRRRRGGRGRQ